MARPKKADADKHIRQCLSFNPELYDRLLKCCQAEDRNMSWIISKALDQWMKERGY